MRMPKKYNYIYVAGPLENGDWIQNIRNMTDVCNDLLVNGYYPFNPLANVISWQFVHPHPVNLWMEYDLAWLSKCDALIRLPGPSEGADSEESLARDIPIPVFDSVHELILSEKA